MDSYADLELSLHRTDVSVYHVDFRFSQPMWMFAWARLKGCRRLLICPLFGRCDKPYSLALTEDDLDRHFPSR
jgi:hypothetical protein